LQNATKEEHENREKKGPLEENPNGLTPARYNESIWLGNYWMSQAARRIGLLVQSDSLVLYSYSVLPIFLRSRDLHAAITARTGTTCAGLGKPIEVNGLDLEYFSVSKYCEYFDN
jgi:hypothetical protein